MARLKIKNFGPVKDAHIEIRRLNLYIGEQSIGKSTIAKLITIFTDYVTIACLCSKKTQKNVWGNLLYSFDLQNYITSIDYTIVYEAEIDGHSIIVKINSEGIYSEVKKDSSCLNDSEILMFMLEHKPIYHDEQLNVFDKDISFETFTSHLADIARNSLYVPAERALGSIANKLLPAMMMSQEQMPKNLLRFINELNNAKAKYSNYHLDILNITFKSVNDNDYVVFENGKSLPLRETSSGMQSLIPLVMLLEYGKENKQYESFVVEEPECNLFPEKQKQLLELLVSSIYASDRILTITTHSPYLLSALNNYLYAGDLARTLSDKSKESLASLVDSQLWIDADECAVYSLGEEINDGVYCKSIIDTETNLIDFNYLDGVSLSMSEKFSQLEKLEFDDMRQSKK